MVKLTDVTVKYGKNAVLENFSSTFGKGVNVIVGKSGCGKTTLLNVIANLTEYSGECVADKPSMVFQEPNLAPVKVWQNVDLVMPRGNNKQRIAEFLELAQIGDKADRIATTLSGGEQRRVDLARAFASLRNVMLFDEPFSGLDYATKSTLYKVMDDMLAENGNKTVLLVTHDADDALALGDNVYLMSGNPAKIELLFSVPEPRAERDMYGQAFVERRKAVQNALSK